MSSRRRLLRSTALMAAVAVSLGAGAALAQERVYSFDIPAASLSKALRDYGRATHQQLLFTEDLTAGKSSSSVQGSLSAGDALQRLLAGSGLRAVRTATGAFVIQRGGSASPPGEAAVGAAAEPTQVSQVTVTGTNIRGIAVASSPLTVIDREQIITSGANTVDQLLANLPQNSGVGASEEGGHVLQASTGLFNQTGGAGVNLLGLGNNATLVLVDGHRVPTSGLGGQFSDVSLIPLGALQRVEVITDGSSAIYGDDAVAGVVNFVLRKDFTGGETTVKTGVPTEGGGAEWKFNQLLGAAWDSGSALVNYEYLDRRPLYGRDRSFVDAAVGGDTLIPARTTQALTANISQSIGPRITLHGEGSYAHRITHDTYVRTAGANFLRYSESQYGGSGGASIRLSRSWTADLGANYSENNFRSVQNTPSRGTVNRTLNAHQDLRSVEAKMDGTVLALPGGDLKAAFGGQWRREAYSDDSHIGIPTSRTVSSGFGELNIPIISSQNNIPGFYELSANVAGRYSQYSDFGDTFNPKVGAVWALNEDLRLRGSYGTSFRAPLLSEEGELPFNFLTDLPVSPGSPVTTPVLELFGVEPHLKPEKSRNFTAGLDWKPHAIAGLSVSLSYFNINFTDKILSPSVGQDALYNPIDSVLVTQSPSQADILAAQAKVQNVPLGFFNGTRLQVPVTSATAIVDRRIRNFSRVEDRGVIGSVDYSFPVRSEAIANIGVSATYYTKYQQQLLPTLPSVSFVGVVFNVPRLKLNANASIHYADFSVSAILHYTGAFVDNQVSPAAPIGSWTNVDLSGTAKLDRLVPTAMARGASVTVAILNLFAKDPPFVPNASAGLAGGIGYDPTNATALGRVVSIQLTKRW